MFLDRLTKLFDANPKKVRQLASVVAEIDSHVDTVKTWKHEDFLAKTDEYRAKLSSEADGSIETETKVLDAILPEAFAMVREAAYRVIGEHTYPEQLMVGIALHQGNLAEQKTGEGKTHAALHPLYLNALSGKGAHLVTVNDYLARRDAEWMGPVFAYLGLTVGVINSQTKSYVYEVPESVIQNDYVISAEYKDALGRGDFLREVTRREVYQCDVTYGTNNEFGFDYLRDNMVQRFEHVVQTSPRGDFGIHHFTIVDEADSILIDEARTPLIISAPAEESNQLYARFAQLMPRLNAEDYVIDEKARSVHLTDLGVKKIESWLKTENVYEDFELAHHLDQALKAQYVFQKDTDYVVQEDQVIIVDTFTGRLMPGRRYSEGLHQALEAKEKVPIQKESKTLATITFQNYFRLYEKLAGMSATIMTESEEFFKIYDIDSIEIPTHRPVARFDHADRVYKNQRAKWKAIVDEVAELHAKGQPVLVGTTSVEKNELVGNLLKRRKIPHEILNAKNHEREAEIVAKAGQKGSVTIATNMAGRGTDIKISDAVKEVGGLFVIGTERHESRRIDNQLRGRSGRQGDPGASRFYVALDDDLMRIFNGERIASLMTRFNLPEDVPIEAGIVTKSIENSQKKVESYNFDIRKHLVEYDDVINKQREVMYARRRGLLDAERSDVDAPLKEQIFNKFETVIGNIVQQYTLTQPVSGDGDEDTIIEAMSAIMPLRSEQKATLEATLHDALETGEQSALRKHLMDLVNEAYAEREERFGAEAMRQIERTLMLSIIDYHWMEHIDALDELRYGVRLRAYGQRDPLVEFKNEGYAMFERLIDGIDDEIAHRIFKVQLVAPLPKQPEVLDKAQEQHKELGQFKVEAERPSASTQTPVVKSEDEKIGRNTPCPCGSGKKYKQCGLKNTPEHQSRMPLNEVA